MRRRRGSTTVRRLVVVNLHPIILRLGLLRLCRLLRLLLRLRPLPLRLPLHLRLRWRLARRMHTHRTPARSRTHRSLTISCCTSTARRPAQRTSTPGGACGAARDGSIILTRARPSSARAPTSLLTSRCRARRIPRSRSSGGRSGRYQRTTSRSMVQILSTTHTANTRRGGRVVVEIAGRRGRRFGLHRHF